MGRGAPEDKKTNKRNNEEMPTTKRQINEETKKYQRRTNKKTKKLRHSPGKKKESYVRKLFFQWHWKATQKSMNNDVPS